VEGEEGLGGAGVVHGDPALDVLPGKEGPPLGNPGHDRHLARRPPRRRESPGADGAFEVVEQALALEGAEVLMDGLSPNPEGASHIGEGGGDTVLLPEHLDGLKDGLLSRWEGV
jgi:hypothetical protein